MYSNLQSACELEHRSQRLPSYSGWRIFVTESLQAGRLDTRFMHIHKKTLCEPVNVTHSDSETVVYAMTTNSKWMTPHYAQLNVYILCIIFQSTVQCTGSFGH